MGPAPGVFDAPAGPPRGERFRRTLRQCLLGRLCHPSAQLSPSPPAPPPVLFQGGLLSHPPWRRRHQGLVWAAGPASWEALASVGCPPQQEPVGGRGRLLTSSGACGVRAARTPWLCPLTLWRALRVPGWCSQNRLVCVLLVSRGDHTVCSTAWTTPHPFLNQSSKLPWPPSLSLGVDATRQVRKWSLDRASPCRACAVCGPRT